MESSSQLLPGKVAIITGAATGIGRAIALSFISHGASVCINHYPDPRSAEQYNEMLNSLDTAQRDQLIAVPGDISRHETATELVRTAVAEFGRLDIFVSNAGICQFHEFLR